MKTAHRTDTLTQASLADMAAFKGRSCLSLYQPTHRRHPDNHQDPIRLRHLVQVLESSLRQQQTSDAVKVLLEPCEALAQDHDFWNHRQGGLAVLGAPGLFRTPPLSRIPQENPMKIQLNTDVHIEGTEALAEQVNASVEQALEHFREHITRV